MTHLFKALFILVLISIQPSFPVGTSCFTCHPTPEQEQQAVKNVLKDFKKALLKNDKGAIRNLLGDPIVVRLNGKKRSITWDMVKVRFDEIFGPRVRNAVNSWVLKHAKHGWFVGDHVVTLDLVQHGVGCEIEILCVFEEPPAKKAAQP